MEAIYLRAREIVITTRRNFEGSSNFAGVWKSSVPFASGQALERLAWWVEERVEGREQWRRLSKKCSGR